MNTPGMLEEQIKKAFKDEIDDSLVSECVELCKHYNLDGAELYWKWEVIKYNNRPKMILFTQDTITSLREQLQREAPKTHNRKQPQLGRAALSGSLSRNLGLLGRPAPGVKLEPKKEQIWGSSSATARPSKVRVSRPERREYKYMYERILERSGALDDQIDGMAELVQAFYQVDELGDPAASTEEEITVVGRITLDSDSIAATHAKLNEASLAIESSRAIGSGSRTTLKFDPNVRLRGAKKGIGGAEFFPGAIVVLRGINGGGGWFNVTEVLPLPPLPTPSTTMDEPSTFTVSIASGPFTAESNLKYESWQALLGKWRTERPDIILLTGPFIDWNHISIKTGDIDTKPAELFRSTIAEPLSQLLDSLPGTSILVVPSVCDLVSDHAAFPQAELGTNIFDDPRIYSLPNPCRFALNDIPFAVSSVDVLFHLRKEVLVKPMSEINPLPPTENETAVSDSMAKLCRHVLQQRSFYPIFPPPFDLVHEVNLDVSHSEGLRLIGEKGIDAAAPSIIVLPSKLKQFHKIIDETLFVNPSSAAKGSYTNVRIENGKVTRIDMNKHTEAQVDTSKHTEAQIDISKHAE